MGLMLTNTVLAPPRRQFQGPAPTGGHSFTSQLHTRFRDRKPPRDAAVQSSLWPSACLGSGMGQRTSDQKQSSALTVYRLGRHCPGRGRDRRNSISTRWGNWFNYAMHLCMRRTLFLSGRQLCLGFEAKGVDAGAVHRQSLFTMPYLTQ
jgi:hypothetical protein